MNDDKRALLDQVENDREQLIDFLRRFVQAASPNPPGDTREAVAHIRAFLDSRDLPYRIIDPKPEFPNVVGSFEVANDTWEVFDVHSLIAAPAFMQVAA